MTQVGVPIASKVDAAGLSYVEWGAVFAGAILAAALSFVLLTLPLSLRLCRSE
jgi:hypothetical protein